MPNADLDAQGWRVPALEVAPPQVLVERGLALLEGLADDPTPVLRWYRSTSTAVVLGRGQRLPAVAAGGVGDLPDGAAAARAGAVALLARHSGGGAVLMDPSLLSLDVLLPAGHPLLEGDLSAVFSRVGEAWKAALEQLGVDGLAVHRGAGTARRRGTERERLLAAVCYATVGRGEVLAGGRKLVGLAQRRRRQGALVQCGLLRRWRPAALLSALGAAPDDPEVADAAVGLDDLGRADLDDRAVISAVSSALLAGYRCPA